MRPATALRSWPRLSCVAALGLAAGGEALVRTGHAWYAGAGLTFLGALVLAPGGWPAPAPEGAPAALVRRAAALAWGAAATAALAAASAVLLWRHEGQASFALWLASLAGLLVSAAAAGRGLDVSERWAAARLPASRSARLALVAFGVVLLAGAAAARLWNLGRVPLGVNPDEGDRAALAIQIAKGFDTAGWFRFGWYHISMVYFRLLAAVMSVAGLDTGGARVFGALCGLATVAIVTVLAVRNFGWRAGLLAGTLLSFMGGAIQFSRVTTEATPTQTLWALSAAGFLEAARRGRAWAWGLAGCAGGLSIFFYPTGRLWCLFAIPFSIAVLWKASRDTRARTAAGIAFAALAAVVAAGPFLVGVFDNPGEFTVRARETTIFVGHNAARLHYVRPEWGVLRLLVAQVEHGVGFFNRYVDQNIVWPTDRPLFPPALAALTLLGVLAASLKARDLRLLCLALWFWIGYSGVLVTVETPNMHRSATAIPVLPLVAALVLDEAARRFGGAGRARAVATAAAALAVALCAGAELAYYFGVYAKLDRWPYTRTEGAVAAEEGATGWAVTLGDDAHMVNSGWVRLEAPLAHRLGVATPGIALPLAVPAVRDLSFIVYPRQNYYLPYLEGVYPGGARHEARHFPHELVSTVYRVPLAAWERFRGALVSVASEPPVRVDAIGDPPPGAAGAERTVRAARWSAAIRVPRYGNVRFSIQDGVLAVDGREILHARGEERETTVALPEGDHRLDFRAPLGGAAAPFRWQPEGESSLRRTRPSELWAVDGPPEGLLGTYTAPGRPVKLRLDSTIAAMSLGTDLDFDGEWTARWRGTLLAPADGPYAFGFLTNGGTVEMTLDGGPARGVDADDDSAHRLEPLRLARGAHAVEIVYKVVHRPAAIDWIWVPPGGVESLVPPSVLRPPPDAGPRPALPPGAVSALRAERVVTPYLITP
ncbi:MAG TPA: glycosyltransferase family 39 protein [Thermoanaerobaculia bacterium]|nr:glycosyltransferase family 39 protein [Thermoanaerobaculia bacterium]